MHSCRITMTKQANQLQALTQTRHQSSVCCGRYPYQRIVTLTNASKLPCKCEVMGQEARSQGLATFTTSPNSGVIPAKGTLDVVVTLQASRLGRIQLPLQIKVCVMLLRTLTWDCDLSCAAWLCNWITCVTAASACMGSLWHLL